MNTKFYGALLALGLAISGLAKAGTSGDTTPVNIGLVINAGFTPTGQRWSMLSYRNYEWDQLGASALSAQRAAVDLPMTTPGFLQDQPAGPTPFFSVVVHFTPGYHRGSTPGVAFTAAFK
jgi:hypothetical protein